jgi:hypothetical protein
MQILEELKEFKTPKTCSPKKIRNSDKEGSTSTKYFVSCALPLSSLPQPFVFKLNNMPICLGGFSVRILSLSHSLSLQV